MKIKYTLLWVGMVLGIQLIPVADAAVIERSRTISSVSDDTVGFGPVPEANTSFKFTINADNVKAKLTTSQLQNWTIDDQFSEQCGGQAIFTSQAIGESVSPSALFTANINGTFTECEGEDGSGGASPFAYALTLEGDEVKIEPAEKYIYIGEEIEMTAKDKDTDEPVSISWTFKDEDGNEVGTSEDGTTATFSSDDPGIYTISGVTSDSSYVNVEDGTVTVVKVTVDKIAFNHNPASAANDALNIREDFDNPISVPEYVNGGQNKPATYLRNKAVTILVRLEIEPDSVTSIKIKGVSDDQDGSLGDAEEKEVSFVDGVSNEGANNPATAGIDESEYAEFTINGNTPNKVFKSEETWKWTITEIEGSDITDAEVQETSGHVIYVLWDTPKAPWNQTHNNSRNPWVSALEFAIITCKADNQNNKHNIMSMITAEQGIPYQGAAHYTDGSNFNLTEYINLVDAGNCLDSAQGLALTARLLGIDANAISRRYFFKYNHHSYVNFDGMAYDSCLQIQDSITDFHDSGIFLSPTFIQYWNVYHNGVLHGYDIINGLQVIVPVSNNQWNPTTFE